MTEFAAEANQLGWTLRSGAAQGADTAFEAGAGTKKEIFLPWGAFNGSRSQFTRPSPDAYVVAAKYHPAWDKCSQGTKALHARNAHQILGRFLNDPVKFVLCWTENGELKGGTATGIRIALGYHIPVFNLGHFTLKDEERLLDILQGKQ